MDDMIERARRSILEKNIEDIDTVLKYIDYFEYGFSEKGLAKRKKKLLKYKEKLENILEVDE